MTRSLERGCMKRAVVAAACTQFLRHVALFDRDCSDFFDHIEQLVSTLILSVKGGDEDVSSMFEDLFGSCDRSDSHSLHLCYLLRRGEGVDKARHVRVLVFLVVVVDSRFFNWWLCLGFFGWLVFVDCDRRFFGFVGLCAASLLVSFGMDEKLAVLADTFALVPVFAGLTGVQAFVSDNGVEFGMVDLATVT